MDATDRRADAAQFYDLQPFADDAPFFRRLVPSPEASCLELGCGTGRVTIALADACARLHGIDRSPSMLAIARRKVDALPALLRTRVALTDGDVADFDLGRTFDLVVAPYRVFQALETDAQIDGFLRCVRRHMAPGGSCVLTMFNPRHDPETIRRSWVREGETPDWEREVGGERIVATERRPRLDPEPLVLHPELVFRRYRGPKLLETIVMPIAMRCWFPAQIVALLESRGFRIVGRWGGYHGEPFGVGPELVVQFVEEVGGNP